MTAEAHAKLRAQVITEKDGTVIARLICQRRMVLVPCHMNKNGNFEPIGWSPMEDGDEMWLVMRKHRILDANYLQHWFNRWNRKPKSIIKERYERQVA